MGIFLEIKQLMQLTGTNSYKSAQKQHKTIREAIAPGKRKLTIREYCQYEGLNYDEVIAVLKGSKKSKMQAEVC